MCDFIMFNNFSIFYAHVLDNIHAFTEKDILKGWGLTWGVLQPLDFISIHTYKFL